MEKLKIFFDVDGVLIDGWHARPELRKPWTESLETDLGVSADQFGRLFFAPSEGAAESIMETCLTGRRDLREALRPVLAKLAFEHDIDDFVDYWFAKDSNVNAALLSAVDTSRATSTIETFVATSQEHHRATYLWHQLGFSTHFERMYYSAELGYSKTDIRFFESINAELNIGVTENPLFFDDDGEITALARRAGWDAVVFETVDDLLRHPRVIDRL